MLELKKAAPLRVEWGMPLTEGNTPGDSGRPPECERVESGGSPWRGCGLVGGEQLAGHVLVLGSREGGGDRAAALNESEFNAQHSDGFGEFTLPSGIGHSTPGAKRHRVSYLNTTPAKIRNVKKNHRRGHGT